MSETWLERDVPQVKVDFLADPEGKHPKQHADARERGQHRPGASLRHEVSALVPEPAPFCPTRKLLILNGTDQDSSLGPSTGFGRPCSLGDGERALLQGAHMPRPRSTIPRPTSTIALENAQKLQPMFARSYVIQTGRGWHDWKVASVGEVDPQFFPGPQTIGGYDPFYYTGDTYLLDVRAAVRDPEREVTGENHWEFVASAQHRA